MKKDLLRVAAICVTVLMVVSIASLAYAEDGGKTRTTNEKVAAWQAQSQDIGKKLCRGLVNIITFWYEIPKGVCDTTKEYNILSGCTIGLVKGVGIAAARLAAGMYETASFPFPIPEGYTPIIEPEFIFGKDKE